MNCKRGYWDSMHYHGKLSGKLLCSLGAQLVLTPSRAGWGEAPEGGIYVHMADPVVN